MSIAEATDSELEGALLHSVQRGLFGYSYRGIQTLKSPFDWALYPMLLWEVRPRTIIEIGSNRGGSALWLADTMRAFGIPAEIHSIDVSPVTGLSAPGLYFHRGDARCLDQCLSVEFMGSLPRPLLVIEDSDHQKDTVLAVLNFFDRWLLPGEYIIVEDGIVTQLGIADQFEGGPQAALALFLDQHAEDYEIDTRYCDFYGKNVTYAVNGYLRRRGDARRVDCASPAAGQAVVAQHWRFPADNSALQASGTAVSATRGAAAEAAVEDAPAKAKPLQRWWARLLPPPAATPPRLPPAAVEYLSTINALYEQVLGRAVDPEGSATHSALLAQGATADMIGRLLAQSLESQNNLNLLYLQILGRPADTGGLATFTALLASGTKLGEVRRLLAQSSEAESALCRVYEQTLGRPADPDGLATYTALLADGTSLDQLRRLFAHSPEAQNSLTAHYQQALDRAPTAMELQADAELLYSGTSLDTIVQTLAQSTEAKFAALKRELGSLKAMLQPFSLGAPEKIPLELVEAVSGHGEYNALYRALAGTERPMTSPPSPVPFTSSLCHQHHFLLDQFKYWTWAMKIRPRFHRKFWEWVYIAQTLFERGLLVSGKRGIGFGIGTEPLPALFASLGVEVVASDQSLEAAERSGWVKSKQHSYDLSALNELGICTDTMFSRLVSFMEVDMNDIPASLAGTFDFCWSSCSLEHLGSLKHGLDFIENSVDILRPGGVAVHTTEFNLSSNSETVENQHVCLYRRCDIDPFLEKMAAKGLLASPIDWTLGEGFAELVVDMPPWARLEPHIRLKHAQYDTTSIGLIIQKPARR